MDQPISSPIVSDQSDPICIILSFKDQPTLDIVRAQLKDLIQKIHTTIEPGLVTQMIEQDLKLQGAKPPIIVNQQCLVYRFKCDPCDAGQVKCNINLDSR